MKYARLEHERRFLLRELPAGIDPGDYRRIVDLYVEDTRLRLRRVESPSGEVLVRKLGHKCPVDGGRGAPDPAVRSMTSMYLDEREYGALETLGGTRLSKRRYAHRHDGRLYSIDVFEPPRDGLILAEIEIEDPEELRATPVPAFAVREVTDDPFFTGGRLARTSADEIRRRLA